LNAETRLSSAVTLELENVNELIEFATAGKIGQRYLDPGAIVRVVLEFLGNGSGPGPPKGKSLCDSLWGTRGVRPEGNLLKVRMRIDARDTAGGPDATDGRAGNVGDVIRSVQRVEGVVRLAGMMKAPRARRRGPGAQVRESDDVYLGGRKTRGGDGSGRRRRGGVPRGAHEEGGDGEDDGSRVALI
jgi:hypothetical protein